MDNASVAASLSRVAEGDKRAFEGLYKAFSRIVYAYALNQLNDPARAEEVVSDTMFEVWQHPTRFRGESKFSTWLIGIARNKCLMAYRGRRADEVHEDLEDVAETLETEIEDGFEHVAQSERRESVARCLKGLSVAHREVLHLVYFQDLGLGEVETLIGVPYGTVQTRVHHAKLNIRKCLGRLLLGGSRTERRPA